MAKEYRYLTYGASLRASDDEGPAVSGYAATFGRWSRDLGGFRERIAPGAFSRCLRQGADVRILFNHNPTLILGRTKPGTAAVWEDDRGLGFRAKLPNTQYARDLRESILRGDISQCSFSFQAVGQKWGEAVFDGKAVPTRELTDVELSDCSVVAYPAYDGTSVAARVAKRCVCDLHTKDCLDRCDRFTHEQVDELIEGRGESGMAIVPGCSPDVFERIMRARAEALGIGCRPADDDLDTRIAFLRALKGGL